MDLHGGLHVGIREPIFFFSVQETHIKTEHALGYKASLKKCQRLVSNRLLLRTENRENITQLGAGLT